MPERQGYSYSDKTNYDFNPKEIQIPGKDMKSQINKIRRWQGREEED